MDRFQTPGHGARSDMAQAGRHHADLPPAAAGSTRAGRTEALLLAGLALIALLVSMGWQLVT